MYVILFTLLAHSTIIENLKIKQVDYLNFSEILYECPSPIKPRSFMLIQFYFRELSWVEEFPAHRAAADGDVAGLSHFIQTDPRVVDRWDHDGWAPAHYACW